MPPGFSYPVGAVRSTDVWVPYVISATERDRATANRVFALHILARLKPAITVRQAQADLQRLTDPVAKRYPKWFGASGIIVVTPLRELMVGDVRRWMLVLLRTVALVLMLASVNVAGLLLARWSARTQQLALRAALGASRFRIIRGVLAEGLILSVLGAVGGLALAWSSLSALVRRYPSRCRGCLQSRSMNAWCGLPCSSRWRPGLSSGSFQPGTPRVQGWPHS